jgi:hypothetical protein
VRLPLKTLLFFKRVWKKENCHYFLEGKGRWNVVRLPILARVGRVALGHSGWAFARRACGRHSPRTVHSLFLGRHDRCVTRLLLERAVVLHPFIIFIVILPVLFAKKEKSAAAVGGCSRGLRRIAVALVSSLGEGTSGVPYILAFGIVMPHRHSTLRFHALFPGYSW